MKPAYYALQAHYERCLETHGDNHLGVNWSRQEDAELRYEVMLDLVRPIPNHSVSLLDFGCGASHLYEYLRRQGRTDVEYSGLDLSEKFIALSRQKFPENQYYCQDILAPESTLPEFDYIALNGVFTNRSGMSFDEMLNFFQRLVIKLYPHARKGMAFNVMTKHVDWERDDLFHLPFDLLARFLKQEVTNHFVIRNDYGLYDYTVYLLR